MIVCGLTGSIGMGKSTAAYMLRAMGIMVHDSDKAARDLLEPKGKAFEEVALTFPEAWNKKKHILHRDVLADIIFNNENERRKLERITHPYIHESQLNFIRKAKALRQEKAVLDIPLLYETGAEKRVDQVVVVSAPLFIQRQRVLSRPNMSIDLFEKILKSQMPDAEKCARADFVVQAGLGRAYSYNQLEKIMRGL